MRKLLNYFLKGLLIFVPIALTFFIIIWFFTKVDGLFGNVLNIKIPGLGLVITFVLIMVIGFTASNFIGKKLFASLEKIIGGIPFIKLIYGSIKDLVEAFAGEKKKFDKPVLVTISGKDGPKVLGFITRESLDEFGLNDHVAVYLPQSYNFAGNLLLFPRQSVVPVNVDSSDVMAFIISGGVSGK